MSLPADAILQDAREKKRVWSLDHLKAMRADRNRYVALYKRKKQLMEKKKTVPYDIFTHTRTTHCQLTRPYYHMSAARGRRGGARRTREQA